MNTTTSITPKTIVVVGATGHQGSSVVQTFLSLRPHWHVRALTRDPTSAAAQKLAAQGAEVVQADLETEDGDTTDAGGGASSLEAAFAGAHAIFLNTDFWAPYRTALAAGATQDAASRTGFATEMRHARHAVAAAAKAAPSTLERFVYSALAPLRQASDGRYTHSYHWDSKAAAASWIASPASGVAEKASYIYVGAYSTNPLILPQRLKKEKLETTTNAGAPDDEEYEYVMRLPAGRGMRMPVLDIAASTGPFVRCLVEDEPAKTNLLAYDEYLDVDGLLRAWTEAMSSSDGDDDDDDDNEKTPLPPQFVQMGLHELSRVTGLPLEVLEAPPFVEEFGYMGGVSGFVEPHQLRNRPGTRTLAVTLKSHGREYLLGAKLPTATTI
ncbi:uncharacterized protein PG986_001991 [Apiospora aurea]|uniref:NmrA-like domain-containing protein n=1 Tax=Apiospora aurea TaxID=335848 RepID=A0ABR1QYL1_9PEZI